MNKVRSQLDSIIYVSLLPGMLLHMLCCMIHAVAVGVAAVYSYAVFDVCCCACATCIVAVGTHAL